MTEQRGVTMNYEQWEKTVPDEIKEDSLWKIEAYRLGHTKARGQSADTRAG